MKKFKILPEIVKTLILEIEYHKSIPMSEQRKLADHIIKDITKNQADLHIQNQVGSDFWVYETQEKVLVFEIKVVPYAKEVQKIKLAPDEKEIQS